MSQCARDLSQKIKGVIRLTRAFAWNGCCSYQGMEETPSSLERYRAQRLDTLTRAFVIRQRQASPMASTRTLPRARTALALTLHWHDFETDLYTVEVSARGCSFFTSNMPSQDEVRVSLKLPSGTTVRVLGTFVACVAQGDRFYVCIRFDAIRAHHEQELAELVVETLLQHERA